MLTGKQREIIERDRLFMSVAWELLLREGYQGLTVERIAKRTGFSKGTIYLRFGSKDGLVVSLGMEARLILHSVLERGIKLPGRPRERMVALGEASAYYAHHYPQHLRVVKLIEAETLLSRVSKEQRDEMVKYDLRIFQLLRETVHEAIAIGDLPPDGESPVEGICFMFWAMVDGVFGALYGGAPLEETGIKDPFAELLRAGHRLMDGYGWRPLLREWDYKNTSQRVRRLLNEGSVTGTRAFDTFLSLKLSDMEEAPLVNRV